MVNFIYDDDEHDRWLIEFNIPVKYGIGPHSLSIPKGIINDWIAVYGYDLDIDDDVNDAAEHMIYFAALKIIHYSNTTNPPLNTFFFSQNESRKAVSIAIDKVKLIGGIQTRRPLELRIKIFDYFQHEVKSTFIRDKDAFEFIRDEIPKYVDFDLVERAVKDVNACRQKMMEIKFPYPASPELQYFIA